MAGPPGIGTASATIVNSGPRPAFDRHEAALRLGEAAHLGTDPSLSALHEVAGPALMYGILNGFLHSAALLGAAGVDAAGFAPLARAGTETVAGWLPGHARQIDEGSSPVLDASLDAHLAAIRHVVEESESAAAGHGGDSYAAVIERFKRELRAV